MRTLLWTWGVWLCVLGPGGGDAHGVDLTRLVKDAQPAVVTVLAYDKEGRLTCQGSGFCISEKGHVITCYHVLEGAYRAEVKSLDGRRYPVKSVLVSDSKADLAKVLVDGGQRSIRPIEIDGAMPSIAERIVVIGSPLGLEQTVSEGIVSGIRLESERGKSFQISASTSKGSSGGPVLNMAGKVVGVVSSQAIEGQNLNFAVSAEQVLKLAGVAKRGGDQESPKAMVGQDNGAESLELGRACLVEGQYGAALEHLKGISRGSAQFKPALMLSGLCYSKLGLRGEAVRVYREAIQLDPSDVQARLCLGLGYNAMSQHAKAAETYRETVRLAPERADVRLCLAMACSQAGQYKAAIEAYGATVRIDPGCADAYYGMGLAHYKLGDCEAAVNAYKKAIERQPEYSAARFGLGLTFAALGNREMAMEQYAALRGREHTLAAKLLAAVGE